MDVDFQEVWNRVTSIKPKSDEEQLLAFWSDERRDAADYARLAGCTGPAKARQLFTQLSKAEKEHAKQLCSMAYLLSKSVISHRPVSIQRNKGENTLQALKRRFAEEEKGAAAYASAAASTGDRRLQALYSQLSEEERQHGRALWSLLNALM